MARTKAEWAEIAAHEQRSVIAHRERAAQAEAELKTARNYGIVMGVVGLVFFLNLVHALGGTM